MRLIRPVAALTLVSGLLMAGCTGGVDKAGGRVDPAVTVLRMVSAFSEEEVLPYVDAVRTLSHGTLRIDLTAAWHADHGSGPGGTAEADVIRYVSTGGAPLGLTGARAWDSVGVHSFDALAAPLTIDSMALQRLVLASRLVDPMLAGTAPAGVTGLGVLAGPLRHPVGVSHALVTVGDYRDAVLGISASELTTRSLKALGAGTPVPMVSRQPIDGLDGTEAQLSAVAAGGYDHVARSVTANVTLWPRPLVVFASPASLAGLPAKDRQVLSDAARAALPASVLLQLEGDKDAVGQICRHGLLRFVTATPDDLTGLRRAVAPVIGELRADPTTRVALDGIARLRTGLTPEPPPSCRGIAPVSAADKLVQRSPLDGTWAVTTSLADAERDPDYKPGEQVALENYGRWVYVIDRGRFAFTQQNGAACTWGYGTWDTGKTTAHMLFIGGGGDAPSGAVNRPGESFFFGWSLFQDTLTLTDVPGQFLPSNFRLRPWHRVSSEALAERLDSHCPPPSESLPRR